MRTCKEVSMLLSQSQDRPLGMAEKLAVTLHLAICHGCANFRRQLKFLRTAARRWRDGGDAR